MWIGTLAVIGGTELTQFFVNTARHIGKQLLSGSGIKSVQHAIVGAHVNHFTSILFIGLVVRKIFGTTQLFREQMEALLLAPCKNRTGIHDIAKQFIPATQARDNRAPHPQETCGAFYRRILSDQLGLLCIADAAIRHGGPPSELCTGCSIMSKDLPAHRGRKLGVIRLPFHRRNSTITVQIECLKLTTPVGTVEKGLIDNRIRPQTG